MTTCRRKGGHGTCYAISNSWNLISKLGIWPQRMCIQGPHTLNRVKRISGGRDMHFSANEALPWERGSRYVLRHL